ncbi:hypothetical protein N7463_000530 [Penicillium fimorum]|uniref:Uncharacterized protein n=1 Tax=Penicillium fimorum TaxID=1882269 RepID=A0A9X0CBL5_9EURO|nr:hypothetical protein N7463_000530 [Penicillium fimorum]
MSSQTSPDLPPTGPPPGSAEFLATLLFEESDYSCAHTPKLEPGKESKIPPRLGLFHCTDEDLSYIDTNKLCLACYNAAIPDGFLCWSAFYAKKGRNVFSPDEEYKSGEPTRGNKEFFPRQIQAGKEGFFRKPEPRPGVDTKAAEVAGDLDPNPSSHAYEKRVPSLPPNEDTRTVWRFFEHAKMPFYIDIVHISPPWRGDVGWMRQNKEDLRVGEANAAAYLGAAVVVLAVPEGGDGPYSVVEQRLGTYGSYRLLSLGPWTDDSPAEEASDSEEVTDGKDTKPFDRTGKEAYRGGVFSFFPDKKICDEVNKKATGTVLPPTVDELLRRAYQKELPKNPTKILLSPGHTSSEPPPDIQPDFPVPRVSDIPLVRWPDAERAAYEKGQGLEGVEVGTAYPVESVAGFAMHKPRFMLKPMYKQSSHGVRSDGSLSADPYDFSGNELNLLPMKCKMDTCNCPDSEGCKVLNKIRTYLKKRRFLDHKRSYVKKPQQPLDPELWRRYQTPHPDPAPTHFSDDDDDLILQALSPPRRPVQTGIFQYPRSWYLANG